MCQLNELHLLECLTQRLPTHVSDDIRKNRHTFDELLCLLNLFVRVYFLRFEEIEYILDCCVFFVSYLGKFWVQD